MPRLFQIYLLIACIMLIIILCMVSMTGSFPFTSSWNSPVSGQNSDKSHDSNVGQEDPVYEPIRRPDKDRGQSNENEQIAKPKGIERDDISVVDEDQRIFTFDPNESGNEISYQKDLLEQRTLNSDQEKVVAAMIHSWDPYHEHAWGADNLKPISKTKHNWFHVGLTIIDSLDTIQIMGPKLKYAYDQALQWVSNDLTFDIHQDVNCFEMTIRVLGGLLSAFHLSRDASILAKAVDVGDRLIHCFDSPSPVPYSDVNLRSKRPASPAWSPDSSLSEVSSMQIEFRDLSRIVKQDHFENKSFATSQHLHELVVKRKDPLMPMYVNPNTGNLTPSTVTLGARGDSYYEYLLKQFLQTNIVWLRDDYLDAIDAIKNRLMQRTSGDKKVLYIAEQLHKSSDLNPKMDHLTCFLPGTLALGYYHYGRRNGNRGEGYRGHIVESDDGSDQANGLDMRNAERFSEHLSLAEDLARTCYMMYNMTETGLAPEIMYFSETTSSNEDEMYIKQADRHNLLRPEYVESLFYLFHITGKEMYREQGRKILESFNKYSKVESGGYTTIDDVTNASHVRPRNMQESFWSAETLKYLFLLFSDDKSLVNKILDHYVFNSEGHLIPMKAS